MLQNLHEKVHGWLAWVVVGIVASTFVLFGVSYYANSRSSNNVKATVNGQDISRYDFESVYRRLKQQTPNLTASSEAVLKTQALEKIVLDTVMLEAGEKNKFYVSDAQIEDAIVNNSDFKENGVFSSHRFQQLLSNNMYTQSDYLKVMKSGMLNNQVRFSFIATSFALQNELKRYVQYVNQTRDYDYLEINPKALKVDNQPSDKELQAYYQSHQALYKTTEKVALDYVLLSMRNELKHVTLGADEAKSFYNENQANYMSQARYQIKRIFIKGQLIEPTKPTAELQKKLDLVNQSLSKESFAKASEKYSDDLLSSKASTPWITLPVLDKRVASALITLKLNDISEPIFTDKGVEYIQLVAKQDSKLTPFDKVKEAIETNLKADKAQHSFQQKAEQLADLSYQNPDNLQSVAEPLELTVLQSELASKEQGFNAPLDNASVAATAFNSEVLQERNNSQPIQVNDDALVVLRVKQYEKSVVKPFNEVKDEILNHFIFELQTKQAQALAQSLTTSTSAEITTLLAKNNLVWQEAKKAVRAANGESDAVINDFAFELKQTQQGNAHYKQLASGNFAVVKLNKVSDGQLSDVTLEQRALLDEQLASSYGIKAYDLYVQSLKKQAKVDVIQ